tara:strand:+ start:685 stop:900 length:216 start_codon:yes stop_codon:yes gene_type:complete
MNNGIDKITIVVLEQDPGLPIRKYAIAHVLSGTDFFAVFTSPICDLSDEQHKEIVKEKAVTYLSKFKHLNL